MEIKKNDCACGICACGNICLVNISKEEFEIRQNLFINSKDYGGLSADICPIFDKPLLRDTSEEKPNSPRIITDENGKKSWAIPVLIKNCITKKILLNSENKR
jgi:hypothetical protein